MIPRGIFFPSVRMCKAGEVASDDLLTCMYCGFIDFGKFANPKESEASDGYLACRKCGSHAFVLSSREERERQEEVQNTAREEMSKGKFSTLGPPLLAPFMERRDHVELCRNSPERWEQKKQSLPSHVVEEVERIVENTGGRKK